MKRLLLAPLAALSLCSCAPMLGALLSAGGVPTPVQVANRTTLDEAGALATEALYTAAARAGALAFRQGIVAPSTNPAVQSDNFCPQVMAGIFTPTDRGSEVAALECKLRAARDAVRAAYRAGNAADYFTAIREAASVWREMAPLIRGN